jgi:predicted amidohydrolase YtcJ
MLPSLICAVAAVIGVQTPSNDPNDQALYIHGGTLITNQAEQPEVEAILVYQGRIAALGSEKDVEALALAKNAARLDLKGGVLYPGFADGHAHLIGIGLALNRVDLVGTRSMREVLDRCAEFLNQRDHQAGSESKTELANDWLHGRGWDQNDWQIKEFPTHHSLSGAFPERPVLLRRIDGHAALANLAAMQAAGITAQTPDPVGGRIVHDADGNPTGVFIDEAIDLVSEHAPITSDAELERSLRMAAQALHEQGITSIHDAGASRRQIALFQKLAAAGELGLRVHVMVSASKKDELEYWLERGPVKDSDVQVRAIKVYADGALGSRGAAMLEDYSDDAGNQGLLITSAEEIQELARRGLERGFQVCTHAIGDRANRLTLHAYRKAAGNDAAKLAAARFRVEHAQVVAVDDLPLFGKWGVLPAMQPQHQTSDMPWVEVRVGPERARGAYAWKSMIDGGGIVIGGSDAPVERLDPVGSFLAAVTRADADGNPVGGWYPEQAMSRQHALNTLTSWPAYGAFWEDDLGALRVGMHADFTVLDKNLMSAELADLHNTEVLYTIFNGKVVFAKAGK